jgi:hypothetical protein
MILPIGVVRSGKFIFTVGSPLEFMVETSFSTYEFFTASISLFVTHPCVKYHARYIDSQLKALNKAAVHMIKISHVMSSRHWARRCCPAGQSRVNQHLKQQ